MKVLAVVPYLYDTSPGQRFRLEQWEKMLNERDIDITYAPFETPELKQVLYHDKHLTTKVKAVLGNTRRRAKDLRTVRDFDVVYLFREAALFGPPWFERRIARSGVPIVFDFDDAVFVPYRSPSNGYLSYLKLPQKTAEICRLSSHVMAGNAYLAEYAGQFNENVTIIPTTIDTDKYPLIERSTGLEILTIGWSGSYSTVQHLDTIREALSRLAAEEKFKLRVIGTPRYELDGVEVDAIAWRSETEIEDLGAIDIGLMPLPDDKWSKGKCGLKALQYMALGIPTICSPVGVNTKIIQDGENGFLADSAEEWIEKIKRLLHSSDLRRTIGLAGRKTVEKEYSTETQAPRVAEIFESVAGRASRINMEKKRILVTGGAGFIGSHLVDSLVERGHQVRILDSIVEQVHSDGVPEHLNTNAEFIRADVCDAEAVSKALDGIEVVFHEAAEVGVGQSMYEIVRYVKANDLGTAVLLEEMIKRHSQFEKLVVASSMSIYGEGAYFCPDCDATVHPQLRSDEKLAAHDWEFTCEACGALLQARGTTEEKPLFPTSVYAVSKQDQEQYCLAIGRAYKIPTVAFRYFNVYGTRQALSNPYTGVCAIFSSRLLNDQSPMIFEDGEQSRDFVHVSDIVQANLLALETNRGDYQMMNVGTGTPTSVKQIARLLAKGLGKDIEPEIVGKYREGDIRHCVADISKITNSLGYKPKVTLENGLEELLGWVSKQKADDRVAAATAELSAHSLVK